MNDSIQKACQEIIEIGLFGAPCVKRDGVEMEIPRRQSRAILFILAAQSRPASRDSICDLLWEDASNSESRRNLTRLLTQLRLLFHERSVIQSNSDKLWLNQDLVQSGIQAFENFSRNLNPKVHLEVCGQVIDFYKGTFLDGFNLSNAPHFDHWLAQQRHSYEAIYLHALHDLIEENASAGNIERAIQLAQRYLGVDEIDEHIQRRLIELLAANGNRLEAQRQFERYAHLLKTELNDDPQPEMIYAYRAALEKSSAAGLNF